MITSRGPPFRLVMKKSLMYNPTNHRVAMAPLGVDLPATPGFHGEHNDLFSRTEEPLATMELQKTPEKHRHGPCQWSWNVNNPLWANHLKITIHLYCLIPPIWVPFYIFNDPCLWWYSGFLYIKAQSKSRKVTRRHVASQDIPERSPHQRSRMMAFKDAIGVKKRREFLEQICEIYKRWSCYNTSSS